MVKKKQEKPQREVTKRQLSRWQKERRRERIIFFSGVSIIAAVLCIVVVGWFTSQFLPRGKTVITVNDVSFNMNYYINTLKYYGKDQPALIYSLANEAANIIVQNELIRQEAPKLAITVSKDEVDKELKSRAPPLSKDYWDFVLTEMLVTKLMNEHFEHQVPMFAEQVHLLAMFLESESQALEVTDRLESSDNFTEVAGELSLDAFTKEIKGDLGWQIKELQDILVEMLISSIPGDNAFSVEVGAVSQPLYDETKTKGMGYWLIKLIDRDKETDEILVHAMLLSSEEQVQELRARLEDGEEFAKLAGEFSQLEEAEKNGGEIGPLSQGMMGSAFDEFAFDPEVELGTLSEPIRDDTRETTGGYWLLKVLAKEADRRVEDEARNFLKSRAFNEWITSLRDDPENKIESFLDDNKIAWAIEKAAKELGQ